MNKRMTPHVHSTISAPIVYGLAILLPLLSFGPGVVLAQDAAEPEPWRQFEIMGKVVTVQPELGEAGVRSYEVLAEEGGLAVARLSVNRNGVLSDAWKTDLDSDGNPEIVVIVGQLQGSNAGSADIHEWDGHKFASVRATQKISSEGMAYDGHDQYSIANGKLVREFPRFTNNAGSKVPSGDKAKYEYDMQAGRWVAL